MLGWILKIKMKWQYRIVMNRKMFFILCLLFVGCFYSCNNSQVGTNNSKGTVKNGLDTIWNENVQDSFYGLTLGEPASVAQITKILGQYGFYLLQGYSSEELLHFRSSRSRYFAFGGLSWEMLDLRRNGNVLKSVCFMNSSLDKVSSLNNYNNIKSAVNLKYSPTVIFPKDSTIYAQTSYFGRNNIGAMVSCFRYETVEKKIMIGVVLAYESLQNFQIANSEL